MCKNDCYVSKQILKYPIIWHNQQISSITFNEASDVTSKCCIDVHSTSRVQVFWLSLKMWLPCILLISTMLFLTKGHYGNESPSTVLIFTREQEYLAFPLPHCCGTILSQDTVITAANCFGTGTFHIDNFFLVAGDLQPTSTVAQILQTQDTAIGASTALRR